MTTANWRWRGFWGDGTRQRTQAFSELQSHYLFAERFERPGKGNDKGKVEGLVGYARRHFLVPIPRCSSWQELNSHLREQRRKRRERRLRGKEETIGSDLKQDAAALLPLPSAVYEACEKPPHQGAVTDVVRNLPRRASAC